MPKQDILVKNGTYNRNHASVTEQRFMDDDFYDPRDLTQVKYEMLRAVRESKESIGEIAIRFGFSRAGFYKVKDAFEREGLSAFVSNKSGPHGSWKLTREHRRFIDGYLLENPSASSADVVSILQTQMGLIVSKRTIERYRSQKKQRA